jgi:MFS family permease
MPFGGLPLPSYTPTDHYHKSFGEFCPVDTSIDPATTVSPTGATVTRQRLRRWIVAYNIFSGTSNLTFTTAVWVIYLAANGYDPLVIGLMETIFHAAKFIAEVPTGAFADLVGRRASLIAFCLISCLAEVMMLYPAPLMIGLSFTLSGISYAFRGGAGEALLWDMISQGEETNRERIYSQIVSIAMIVDLVGQVIGAGLGGYLGHFLLVLPFLVQGAARFLAIVPLMFVLEKRAESLEQRNPIRHIWQGMLAARHDSVLLGLLLLSATIEASYQTIFYYHQLYLRQTGISLITIGFIFSASTLTSALFTAIAPPMIRWLTRNQIMAICVLSQALGFILICIPQPLINGIGFVCFVQFGISLMFPASSTYLNVLSPETQRATILSFQTGLFSLLMIVLFPLFGLGVTHLPFAAMYGIVTVLLLVIGGGLFRMLRGTNNQQQYQVSQ